MKILICSLLLGLGLSCSSDKPTQPVMPVYPIGNYYWIDGGIANSPTPDKVSFIMRTLNISEEVGRVPDIYFAFNDHSFISVRSEVGDVENFVDVKFSVPYDETITEWYYGFDSEIVVFKSLGNSQPLLAENWVDEKGKRLGWIFHGALFNRSNLPKIATVEFRFANNFKFDGLQWIGKKEETVFLYPKETKYFNTKIPITVNFNTAWRVSSK